MYSTAGTYDVRLVVQSVPYYGSCTDTLDMHALIMLVNLLQGL